MVWDHLALNPAIHPLVRTVDPVVQVVMAALPAQRVTVALVAWADKVVQVVLLALRARPVWMAWLGPLPEMGVPVFDLKPGL